VLLIGPAGLRLSTNGGQDFAPNRQKVVLTEPLFHADAAGDRVFAYGAGRLLVSRNGESWARVRRPFKLDKKKRTDRDVEDVDFLTANLGFLLDDLGRVWKTRDGGAHWRQLVGVGTEQGYDIEFSDPRNGWIALDEFGEDDFGYVLRTSDGGETWRPQLIGKEKILHGGLVAPGPATGFALAAPNLLFGTTTGGDRGDPTEVRLSITRVHPGKPGVLKIDGTLNPAEGGERIVVSKRAAGDASWEFETLQVATNGTFTVVADVQKTTQFVAQWSGDDTRLGDGSAVLTVPIKKPKKKKGAEAPS
jgi:hypothetical protein